MLEHLGNPERKLRCFHVAGTNGKGSTCATIEALLRAGGQRVGRFSSPHLVDFSERITVDAVPIPERRVVALLDRIEPAARRLDATFFEITTALAFAHFAESHVGAAVIETGMGGALDSTNVVSPLVATVTNVSLDHTEYLGNTVEQIARQKSGIFKSGRPAVIGEPRVDIARDLASRASALGATPIVVVSRDWRAWSVSVSVARTSFTAGTPYGELRLTTPLVGEHQVQNALTAMASVHSAWPEFTLRQDEIQRGLAAVRLPGRFQRWGEWIFDVAHNAAAARVLADTITAVRPPRPITLVLAVLKDKDWKSVLSTLAVLADSVVITQPPSAPAERAWNAELALDHVRSLRVPVVLRRDFDAALSAAAAAPGTKIVAGSFHTVGDAMQRLGFDPASTAGV